MSNLLLFPAPDEQRRLSEPPDAAVRAEALDIRRSFIVQAPAGSGKTTLLIQRFLKLLADDSVSEPEQVLAITFTNAATAELRDRVLRALASAAAQDEAGPRILESLAAAPSPDSTELDIQTLELASAVLIRDAALGWQLLRHPHRLNIRTIDSVCAGVARSLPVLSGSGGRLIPVEDARHLHREAARRTLLELGGGNAVFDADLRTLLLHRNGDLADCESLLTEMLALRDQWGDLIPLQSRELDEAWLDTNLLPRLEQALSLAVCAALCRLDALLPTDILHDVASLAGHFGHLPGTNGNSSPVESCAGIHAPPEPIAAHLGRWRAIIHLLRAPSSEDWRKDKGLHRGTLGFEYDRKHPNHAQLARILDRLRDRDDLLTAFAEIVELPDATYPANQWTVAKSLFRILSHTLVELQLVFSERAECDFTELGLLARTALRSSSGANDLADALGSRLQHLLVDEMQDTSTGQYELLELLTASWDGHSQTVFLVGDPFQSIYLFRQARVERFVHALKSGRLGELALVPLALTANFRSQRALVDQFNDDFGFIFPAPATDEAKEGRELHFIRASATKPSSSAEGRVWNVHPQSPADASGGNSPSRPGPTQARSDAESIARIAADWLARPLPLGRAEPWRIAVLVRSRNHLAEVIPALRSNAIPFRAVDIETLRDRQEVLDLTALTRALLHPADRTAVLAVLRAPWCGLPLTDLHTLAGGDDFSLSRQSLLRLIESRAHLLPEDSHLRVRRVHAVLRAAAQLRSRLTTAQLVERTWHSLGGDAPLSSAKLTNARRFFELLDALEASAGRVDPVQLEDRLVQLYAESDPVPPHSGFVELLTIHKAKGLEWDVVFIPSLERRPAFGFSRLLTWSVLEEAEMAGANAAPFLLAPIAARGEEVDALTRWLKKRHREREYEENKRLFYVGCTRARHELHLFAAPTLSSQGIQPGWPDSLLKAAWPAAEPHVAARYRAPEELTSTAILDDVSEAIALAAVATDAPAISFFYTHLPDIDQVINEYLIPPEYPLIERLPLSFDPASRFSSAREAHLPRGESSVTSGRSLFPRPEGSFAARAFGNAVHQCIELIANHTAGGATADSLRAELPAWSSRISALLRANGLPAPLVARLARETLAALQNTMSDPDGVWLLATRPGAANEFSLTVPDAAAMSSRSTTVRVDRIFRGGPEPHAVGSSHLWIADYKTASHGAVDRDAFFASQRAMYATQLEDYARALAPSQQIPLEHVRLALYFPVLPATPRLLWWPYTQAVGHPNRES